MNTTETRSGKPLLRIEGVEESFSASFLVFDPSKPLHGP